MKKILVTGASGFIGFHLSKQLLQRGEYVVGVDNMNNYYDVNLKVDRLKQLELNDNFKFIKFDIANREDTDATFFKEKFDVVVNLAAQAGVRYSLENPHAYIDSNINGFINILEGCRLNGVKHLVFASSSSVYGANKKMPFSVHDNVDHPKSLYAATKKANELMAHTYASLYNIPCTGLRFFTVYGPWGRPDMALFKFTKAILENNPIDVYNYGKMQRDFTFIDDIVEGVVRVMEKIPELTIDWNYENPDPGTSYAPYKLYNIGSHNPVELMKFIEELEEYLGKKAKMNLEEMQPGDVNSTYADVSGLEESVGFKPKTSIKVGIKSFVDWYRDYYKV